MAAKRPPLIERRKITSQAEWLRWRRDNVNASVVGALFGAHPYETIFGLHAQVRGAMLSQPKTAGVLARGIELQELVGRYVQRAHPTWKLRPGKVYLRHREWRLGCTPDFFVRDINGRRGIVEAKTVASAMYRRYWAERPP